MTEAYRPVIDAVWQTSVVTQIDPRTATTKSFLITPKAPVQFVAGQHADVRLTAEDGYTAMRSYSIASAPADAGDGLELVIERLDGGEVSAFFHDVVVPGDEIEIRAPLGGHFVWRPQDGGPLLLVGGGSGLVPLMSMIRQRKAEGDTTPCALIVSARRWEEILFRDELLALRDSDNNFHLTLTVTREIPDRTDVLARRIDQEMVTQALRGLPSPPKFAFLCGANAFVNTASDSALAAGLPASAIRTERYGG